MKNHFRLLFFLFPFFAYSQQPCTCDAELDILYKNIITLNSYKTHIAGKKHEEYKRTYERQRKKAEKETKFFPCLVILSKLLFPLKDNNMVLHQKDFKNLGKMHNEPVTTENAHFFDEKYKKFNIKIKINIDSLMSILKNKPINDIEGIYMHAKLKAGVYRTAKKDSIVGVIIESGHPNWEKGNLAFVLYEQSPNNFFIINGIDFQNTFGFFKNERFSDGRLILSKWDKHPERQNYSSGLHSYGLKLKETDANIQILELGIVKDYDSEVDVFIDKVKKDVDAPAIILDMRDNKYGREKLLNPLFKFLKKYSKKHKVYILVNSEVKNRGERYVADLKGRQNIIIVGKTTGGALSYGYGPKESIRSQLACGNYMFYTNNIEYSDYFDYEGVGITPDYILNPDSDWVEQTINIIKDRNE